VSTDFWVWVSSILSLCIFSFLWKETRAFRVAQNIFLGVGAGHGLAIAYRSLDTSLFTPLFKQGKWSLVIPLVLVIMLYTKFVPKVAWVSRISLAFPLGLGTGIVLRSIIPGQIFPQLTASMKPLNSVNNIIVVLGAFAVVYYFLFTFKSSSKVSQGISRAGVYLMMVTFGLSFATSVAANTAIYLGFLQTIFGDWLGLIR
jgi:hypothetical protein